MIRLTTTRGALGLYGALLVLPTLVFGWLYWRELDKDYKAQLAMVPATAEDGARRVSAGMKDQLEKLIETEERRPFYHYGNVFSPQDAMGDELALQPSPLLKTRPPRGVLGWFSFDRLEGPTAEINVMPGRSRRLGGDSAFLEEFASAVEGFRKRKIAEGRLQELAQLDGILPEPLPLRAVAIHLGHKRDLECLKRCSPLMGGLSVSTGVSRFYLEFYREEDGTPRAVASRRVLSMENLSFLPEEAACLKPLLKGFGIQQGFLLDVDWLFQELPFFIASQALGETEELVAPPRELPYDDVDSVFADIDPLRELGFRTDLPDEERFGKLGVAIDTDHIDARYRSHLKRFLGVGLMLVLSLATGFTLLYQSVNRELEQAHRTQNFVASVTHELRTPLSTIQLHGEMLMDGWVDDADKQREYYRRIVRETKRLSTLVERVLEKSQLKEKKVEPRAGDLNRLVQRLAPTLQALGEPGDLAFEYCPVLPHVWLTSEAVSGILSNLVENARKYAPPAPGAEPILVRTARALNNAQVVLEVADRGPGVPPEERDKIFEAFYRVGSESTRTATGTGLGLHLVHVHAESIRAKASVQSREGGGSLFRIAFSSAR